MTRQQTAAPIAESGSLSVLTGGSQGASGEGDSKPQPFDLSIPSVGAYRTENHRYYFNGNGPKPSVTTILDVMDKPALVELG